MEPLTIAALALGGTKLVGNLVSGIGQYQALKPSEVMQDKIAELERLQEADALGLTGAEKSAYVQSFMDPQRALAQQQMQQSQALTGMAQDSGEQIRRLRAQEEQAQRAQAEAGRQIEMLDLQQARAQEAQLMDLQILEEQRANAQQAALMGIIGGGIGDVGSLAGQVIAAEELTGADAGAYNAGQLQALGAMYGYSFPQYGAQSMGAYTTGMPMMGGVPQVPGYMPPIYYGQPVGQQQPVAPPFTGGNPSAQQGTGEQE